MNICDQDDRDKIDVTYGAENWAEIYENYDPEYLENCHTPLATLNKYIKSGKVKIENFVETKVIDMDKMKEVVKKFGNFRLYLFTVEAAIKNSNLPELFQC